MFLKKYNILQYKCKYLFFIFNKIYISIFKMLYFHEISNTKRENYDLKINFKILRSINIYVFNKLSVYSI